MIFTITLALILASFVAWAVFLDLKRADQRRVARERRRAMAAKLRASGFPGQWSSFNLSATVDLTPFIESMDRAVRAVAVFGEKMDTARLARMLGDPFTAPPCRWCQVLGRVGLAPHAAHYRPRHRAGRA